MEAGTLNCPACGAVVEKDAPQCQYCHALLQTVACPHCMGMMFAGTKFCPHCGVRVETIVQGKDSERHCPRCKVKLEDVQVANTPLEECTRCGGLWVDVTSFEFICANTEAQNAATGLNLPPPVAADPHVHYLPCPQCGNLMSRINYASRSGVIINVCRQPTASGSTAMRFARSSSSSAPEVWVAARRIETEELAEARRAVMFQPDAGTYLGGSLFRDSVSDDDRAHLVRGSLRWRTIFLAIPKRSVFKSANEGVRSMSKIAVVTGAGSGVGHAIALALAKEKFQVVIASRRVELLQQTAALGISPGSFHIIPCDVADEKAVHAMAAEVLKKFGARRSFSKRSAGTNVPERALPIVTGEHHRLIIDVNLNGRVLLRLRRFYQRCASKAAARSSTSFPTRHWRPSSAPALPM